MEFYRAAVEATLPVLNAVNIKITVLGKDREVFEVYYIVSVIDVSGNTESSLMIRSMDGVCRIAERIRFSESYLLGMQKR